MASSLQHKLEEIKKLAGNVGIDDAMLETSLTTMTVAKGPKHVAELMVQSFFRTMPREIKERLGGGGVEAVNKTLRWLLGAAYLTGALDCLLPVPGALELLRQLRELKQKAN